MYKVYVFDIICVVIFFIMLNSDIQIIQYAALTFYICISLGLVVFGLALSYYADLMKSNKAYYYDLANDKNAKLIMSKTIDTPKHEIINWTATSLLLTFFAVISGHHIIGLILLLSYCWMVLSFISFRKSMIDVKKLIK